MNYLPEERETVVRYDELEKCWYFETSVRRHITKIEKRLELYEIISEELDEKGRRMYIHAKLKEGTVSPFARPPRKNQPQNHFFRTKKPQESTSEEE